MNFVRIVIICVILVAFIDVCKSETEAKNVSSSKESDGDFLDNRSILPICNKKCGLRCYRVGEICVRHSCRKL